MPTNEDTVTLTVAYATTKRLRTLMEGLQRAGLVPLRWSLARFCLALMLRGEAAVRASLQAKGTTGL